MKSHKFFFAVVAFVIVFLVFFFAVVKPRFFAAVMHGGNVAAVATVNDHVLEVPQVRIVHENVLLAHRGLHVVSDGVGIVAENAVDSPVHVVYETVS